MSPHSRSSIGLRPPAPPTAVTCIGRYDDDLTNQYAFIFQVFSTTIRFTVCASDVDSYLIGETYTIAIIAPDAVPLSLTADDAEFLRQCLRYAARRWREAIAEADTGAERPQQEHVEQPDCLNVEPTPAGYRAAAHLFRDELARVEQLDTRLGEFLRTAETQAEGDQP